MSYTETPTRDGYWRIAGVPIDGHSGPEPTTTPGESVDFRVLMSSQSDPPDANPEAWDTRTERLDALLAYGPRAGQFALHELPGGTVAYTETHNGRVPGGSLVVASRPPADSTLGRGGWWLVESVEDATTLERLCEVTLSLVYLAPLLEYATRDDLAADLEADALFR